MADACDPLARHERLVAALLAGPDGTVPPAGRRLVQTHISSLILAGDEVFKLRKPLALPFLDFSTVEARRLDCEEELRLNRRTAPALYLDVLPITGTPDAPRVGGAAADAIDWAVRMRRFDEADLLDRRVREGRLTSDDIDALARRLGAFHAALPPSPPAFGDPQAVRRHALDNLDALDAAAPLADEAPRLTALRRWTGDEFARHAELLAARRARGLVREGHGDLHLANLVMLDGQPCAFDALEFNPALRHGDIAGDIAFTFMDLVRHGRPGLAWRLASGWAEATGDHEGLRLLAFFAVYRALVRAKVAWLRSLQGDADGVAAARRDLALAMRLAGLDPPRPAPRLVMTCGLSGSGKSTVALALVEALGAIRLRSDVERKRLHGLDPQARPDPEQAATLYGAEATRRTFEHLAALAVRLAEAGLTVVVDAAFLRRAERDRLRDAARAAGLPCTLVECVAPDAVLRERVGRRQAEGRDASDADLAVLAMQQRIGEPLAADEPAVRLDTDAPRDEVAARCVALAERLRAGAYDAGP